jgi:hypothetical protein
VARPAVAKQSTPTKIASVTLPKGFTLTVFTRFQLISDYRPFCNIFPQGAVRTERQKTLCLRTFVVKLQKMFSPQIRSVHFVGICGTAMASTAAAMQDMGFYVSGSDQNVYPPMSTFLAAKQIEVMNGYAERNLAHKPDLVVIGNAMTRGHPEVEWLLDSRAAARLARGVRAAIVHVHGLDALPDAAAAATRLRLPVVVSLYGYVDEAVPKRSSLRRVSRAIAVAESFRSSVEEALGCEVGVIVPGLDPREFEGTHAPDRVIRDLALDPNTIRMKGMQNPPVP